MANGRRAAVAPLSRHHGDANRAFRDIQSVLRDVSLGRLNNTQEVTLAKGGATSTVLTIRGVRSTSVVLLMPMDANAAASVPTTYAVPTKDTVTIQHAASGLTRTFRLALFA